MLTLSATSQVLSEAQSEETEKKIAVGQPIMQKQGFRYELKGGTSLSKGFGIIKRFSEGIDIRIKPPIGMNVKTGKIYSKEIHGETHRSFYDWIATEINIPDISACRTTVFDDEGLRNSGMSGHHRHISHRYQILVF